MDTPSMLVSRRWRRSSSPHVSDCHNLRPVAGSGAAVLEVVGRPRSLASSLYSPLAADGSVLLVTRGSDLLWIDSASANPVPELICSLPSPALCAYVGASVCIVMTASGPFRLFRSHDGRWAPAGLLPVFPAVSLSAREEGSFQSVVPACSVSEVAALCEGAYVSMARDAAAAGLFVQPLMAQCSLLDSGGQVIQVLPPVLVSLPSGPQFHAPLEFSASSDASSVDALAVSLRAFSLQVDIPDSCPEPWASLVAAMEIRVSPQFHPLDPASAPVASVLSSSRVAVSLSGTGFAHSPSLVSACAARFSSLSSFVARVDRPFASPASLSFRVPSAASPASSVKAFRADLAKPVAPASGLIARIAPPLSFYARSVAPHNRAVAWADITPLRFRGWSIGSYAASSSPHRWTGSLKVDFANGDCVVSRMSGGAAPLSLQPIIAWPAPDAVRLSLMVYEEGDTVGRSLSVPLSPDGSGLRSVYVQPSLAPVPVDGAPLDIDDGDASFSPSRNPGAVAVAPIASPLALSEAGILANSSLSLLPARRNAWASDFGRSDFYAFGTDGIRLVSASSDLSSLSSRLIDSHSVTSPLCVADAGSSALFLAAGSLFCLSGSSVSLLASGVQGDRMAWIAPDREILVADADDSEARHFLFDDDCLSYSSSLAVAPSGWLSSPHGAFAVTDEGLCDLGCRFRSDRTFVRWNAAFTPAAGRRSLPSRVFWMLKARFAEGSLSALREFLSPVAPDSAVVSRLDVSGEIRSPLVQILRGHPLIDLRLKASLAVSQDFTLTFPLISNASDQ